MAEYSVIGKRIPQIDGLEKVTGRAVYCGDIQLPGMLIGKIKRSPYPFARILSINTDKARKLQGVRAVITAQDVIQFSYGFFIYDELPLADKYARFAGDGVAAVAAVDADTAEEALDLIEVEYEELTPVLDPEKAMEPGAPAVHPEKEEIKQNIAYHFDYVRGDGEAAFKQADLILEERFSTQAQYQAYLEPQACVAQWEASGKLTFWGSTQRVFGNRSVLARALGIPEHQIRVIQPYVGGSFGGKEDMHPYWPTTALLAKAANRPVRVVYTRKEDFISGRPRTSQIIDLRLGFKKDGTMVAKSAVITVDSGAYSGICPVVVSCSAIRPDCVYRLPNIKMVANLVYTNTIPRGAFRGFGDPEMLFAMESLIDMAAGKLGIDPIEIRLKNAVQKGDVTVHGWVLNSCGLGETIRLTAQKSGWKNKRQKRGENRGIGVACQVHSCGHRGSHPLYEGSAAIINIDQHGKVRVISGETDMGQGTTTGFAQIAAEALGIPMEDIEVLPYVDSDIAPFCLGTFGTRATVMGGNAVLLAAKDARRQLLKYAADKLGVKAGGLEIKNGKFYIKGSPKELATVSEIARDTVFTKLSGVPITGRGEYAVPDHIVVADKTGYGNYSFAYTYGTAVAEVSVNPGTGKVDVLNIWCAMNVGKAINPALCEGQIEGAVVQGIGYALTENYIWREGRLLNPNFTDYKIPLSQGIPKIHCLLVEQTNPGGPYGATGIGEPPINPIAPAIANAVYDAIGVRIKDLPIAPGKIRKALRVKNKGQ